MLITALTSILLIVMATIGLSIIKRILLYRKLRYITQGMPKIKSSLMPSLGIRSKGYTAIIEEMVKDPLNSSFYDLGPGLFGQPVVGVTNADANREILGDIDRFPKSSMKFIGNGLVFSDGEIWKHQRRRLTPTFHFGALNEAVDYMVQEAQNFLDEIRPGVPMLAKSVFTPVTLRIIIRYAFGGEFDVEWMAKIWTRFMDNFLLHIIYTQIFGERLVKHLPFCHAYRLGLQVGEKTRELIDKRRVEERDSATGRNDLIGTLLDANLNGEDVDEELIVDEAKTFLLAGHETSSNLLSWATYMMCHHPEKQELAFQEIQEVVGDRDITSEDINKLKYVRAILDETQRLKPIVPLLQPRISSEEAEVCGRKFPKETIFFLIPVVENLREKNWENALEFKPERFLNHETRHPYSYIPFSAGPRNCIGKRFAIQEAVIVFAMMLRKYSVSASSAPVSVRCSPTLTPEGFEVIFKPR